jgi:hypothetical protein
MSIGQHAGDISRFGLFAKGGNMLRVTRVLAVIVVLGLLLTSCELKMTPEVTQLGCDGEAAVLTVSVKYPDDPSLEGPRTARFYKEGDPTPLVPSTDSDFKAIPPWEYEAPEAGMIETRWQIKVTTPGVYYVQAIGAHGEVFESNRAVVNPCSQSTRADVAAVIYGGWDGIPVQAWVGGTDQETLYTARDAFGEAAVQWTFYPPEDETWDVKVAPQVPADKDPAIWQYKLVRIELPTTHTVIENPESADVTIGQGSQYVLYFQLVDTGAQAPK